MRWTAILWLCLALPWPGIPAAAAEGLTPRVRALHVRAGPGTEHPVVDLAVRGDRLDPRERRDGWVLVRNARTRRIGWVRARYLRPLPPPSPPRQSPSTAQSGSQPTGTGRKGTRKAPGLPPRAASRALRPAPAVPESRPHGPPGSSIPLLTLRLHMEPLDAAVLMRKEADDTSTFPARVRLEDGTTARARIAVLGSSSRHVRKRSLLLYLEPGHRWHGQRRIALDGLGTDPSLVREWLAWHLFAALGVPGPRVHYVRLFINGRYQGLYLFTEWVDAELLARRGLASGGRLYQPRDETYCGDLRPPFDARRLQHCWHLPDGKAAREALARLGRSLAAARVETFDAFLATHFHPETVLDWLAVNVLLDDGDTYNKNYFLYREPAGRWAVIPWDYDLSFGRNWDPYLPYPRNLFNDRFQYYYPPESGAANPLKEKTLRNPRLRDWIFRRLRHLLGLHREPGAPAYGWFTPAAMQRRLDRLEHTLRRAALADPRLGLTAARWHEALEAIADFTARRRAYLREILDGATPWDPDRATWDPAQAPPPPPLPHHLHRKGRAGPGEEETLLTAPGWGLVVAGLALTEGEAPAPVSAELDAGPPAAVPPGQDPEACIRRTWFVTATAPRRTVRARLSFEYLEENAHRHEKGSRVKEPGLRLWAFDGVRWQPMPTRVNTLSNVLRTLGPVRLAPQHMLRFVACSGKTP